MYHNNRWLLHRSNSMCYIWNSLAIMAKKESFSTTRSPTECMDVQSMISAANRCIVNSLVNFKFGKNPCCREHIILLGFLSGLMNSIDWNIPCKRPTLSKRRFSWNQILLVVLYETTSRCYRLILECFYDFFADFNDCVERVTIFIPLKQNTSI